jgi:TRAP-type C4-dicarboxylate transport system permease small subunit
MKPSGVHRLDDAIYEIERAFVVIAMSLMVLMVFFDVVDRRLEAPESKLAGLMERLHAPAPEITGPIFGFLVLVGLIWFGVATVRRRRGKQLVPLSLEPVLALSGTGALTALGWVMLHRPSCEFYTIIWILCCVGMLVGQMKNRDESLVRPLLAVVPVAALGAVGIYKIVPEGYSWAKEVSMILLVWTGLIGASMASHQGRHIDIDFGKKLFPKKAKRVLTALAPILAGLFTALIVALGMIYVFGEKGLRALGTRFQHTGIPDWIVGLAIPWSFAMISLRSFITARRVLGGTLDAKGSSPSAVQKGLGEH